MFDVFGSMFHESGLWCYQWWFLVQLHIYLTSLRKNFVFFFFILLLLFIISLVWGDNMDILLISIYIHFVEMGTHKQNLEEKLYIWSELFLWLFEKFHLLLIFICVLIYHDFWVLCINICFHGIFLLDWLSGYLLSKYAYRLLLLMCLFCSNLGFMKHLN